MKKLLTLFAVLAFVACTDGDGNKGGGGANYDFERTAAYISAYFYGDLYSPETGTNNYYLTFAILEENSDNEISTHLYWADIYTDGDSLDKIPNGTYKLDLDSTTANGTMGVADSGYEESEAVAFTEGKLVVTDSEIVLTVTTEDGKTHKVTYSGNYEVTDHREDGSGDEGDEPTTFDYEREAQISTVYFYGDEYSADLGTMNYFITLSDSEDTWRYDIDLFAEEMSLEKVPAGTYHFDNEDSGADGTFGSFYSGLYFPQDEKSLAFTEAEFVVTDTEFVLIATTEDGKTHKVTYSGDYEVIDARNSGLSHDYGDWATTLTGDIAVEYDANYAYADYYGDDYDMGYNTLLFGFVKDGEIGDCLWIEIAVENTDFAGTYSPCKTWDYAGVGNLIAANMSAGEPYGGCWYWHSENGEISDDCAPLVAGSLTITDNGDDTYTFAYEGYDAIENGNKVSLNWTGEIEIDDNTQEASAQQRIYPLRREVKMMPMAARSHKKMATKFRK